MESVFISALLGTITSALTWLADTTKIPTRVVLVIFSLAITIIVKFWFHMTLEELFVSSVDTLKSAAAMYVLFSKPVSGMVKKYFNKK